MSKYFFLRKQEKAFDAVKICPLNLLDLKNKVLFNIDVCEHWHLHVQGSVE